MNDKNLKNYTKFTGKLSNKIISVETLEVDSSGNACEDVLNHIDKNCSLEIIETLIGNCMNINGRNSEGVSALRMAIFRHNKEVISLLLNYNVEVEEDRRYLLGDMAKYPFEDFKPMFELLTQKRVVTPNEELEIFLDQVKDITQDTIPQCMFIIKSLHVPCRSHNRRIKYFSGLSAFDYNNRLAEVESELEKNIKQKSIKTVLCMFIDFSKHHPKELAGILEKFSSNEKLNLSNHGWGSPLGYDDFMRNLTEEFKKIADDLERLSPTLYNDIKSFLFDENIIGWSSKIIKEEIKKGILPHNISLDTTNLPFKTFGDAIDNFKSLFVVKQNDKKLKLLKKFTKIKKELGLKNIDLSDLKQDKVDKFFTDTIRFEKALTLILSDIQENSNDNKKNIVIEADTISVNGMDMIEIKIIHIGSSTSKTAEALKETIDKNGGNFQTIYSNLLSVCNWSIDTICKDGKRYRVDYLYPVIGSPNSHCTQIFGNSRGRGFTHILRFYI